MGEGRTPAPCAIVCRTCRHQNEGCKGCLADGGVETCHIRDCAAARGIPGCWRCDDFSCEHIEGLDPVWKGLTIGLIESVREHGEDRFAELALANIGEYAEYGDLRFKSPVEIICCRLAGKSGPEGHRKPPVSQKKLIRSFPYGCRLARVGPEGKPVAIKKTRTFKARHPGELILLVNQEGGFGAKGAFGVEIRRPD